MTETISGFVTFLLTSNYPLILIEAGQTHPFIQAALMLLFHKSTCYIEKSGRNNSSGKIKLLKPCLAKVTLFIEWTPSFCLRQSSALIYCPATSVTKARLATHCF